jgi:nucleotide-binding universal stress UspA family protein
MIIETRDDVVRLSGSLHKNQWLTIKAAANLLLHNHPQGIIIDCSELAEISEAGAKTFLEAMRDIEGARARIMVAGLPPALLAVCRTVPGVRSQLPIAESVEAARASLRMGDRPSAAALPPDAARRSSTILVPLIADLDLTHVANLAGRLARATRADLRVVYFLEVVRNLPLGAPLIEQEQAARDSLEKAAQYAKQLGVNATPHVERVREAVDGILVAVKNYNAGMVVIGATSDPQGGEGHDIFHELVDALLHRAPCEVVIGRLKPPE